MRVLHIAARRPGEGVGHRVAAAKESHGSANDGESRHFPMQMTYFHGSILFFEVLAVHQRKTRQTAIARPLLTIFI